jgi:formylglycine-generating enzyme required for sulfatase activity
MFYSMTVTAQSVLSAMPAELQPLAECFGLLFVQVPAGEFPMGQAPSASAPNTQTVQLDDYWIGSTEVTNAQYRAFVESGAYEDATLWDEPGWQ